MLPRRLMREVAFGHFAEEQVRLRERPEVLGRAAIPAIPFVKADDVVLVLARV